MQTLPQITYPLLSVRLTSPTVDTHTVSGKQEATVF